jgi:hypothetical protein
MAHALAPTAAEQQPPVIESQSAQLTPHNLMFAPIVTTRAGAGDPQPAVSVPREHADSDGRPVKRSFACAALDDAPDRPVKRICAGAMTQEGASPAMHPSVL